MCRYDRTEWRVNENVEDFKQHDFTRDEWDKRAEIVLGWLYERSKSLMDLGCGQMQYARHHCKDSIKYIPVDYVKRSEDTLVCDFNQGQFPTETSDTILISYVLEYLRDIPWFIKMACTASEYQVLICGRPVDKENSDDRHTLPFVSDYSESFLVEQMERNGFYLERQKRSPHNNKSMIYDFRKRN